MSRFVTMLVAALCVGVASGSTVSAAVTVEQYHVHDFTFKAQVTGNPFDAELTGIFVGPGGLRLEIPGFYDGNNTWVVRFSPTRVGQWSMRTVSSVPALNGQTEGAITATANTNPAIHGNLMIDPLHRHHFVYEDGSRYFLMAYEVNWLAEADMKDPARKVMHHLIDQIAARGFNQVLVNVYAHDTGWARGNLNEWDYGPPAMYVFGGTNDAPDHTKLNTDYFKIYDGMMQALQDKGIVANIYLKVYNKMVNWPAGGSKDEERYFRYVTARYQAFSNVVWDFSKEQNNERDKNLEHRLIDTIRSTDAYHHLTTTHTIDSYVWDANLSSNLDFMTDQAHSNWKETVLFDRAVHQWPYMNSELYYERGVDDLPTYGPRQDWQDVVRGAYEIYLSGGYFGYYYSNTAWDLVKPDPEPPGMTRFQILQEAFSTLPYWIMEPRPELAIGGPCLAIPGQIYAFYVAPPAPRGGGAGAAGAGRGAGAAGAPAGNAANPGAGRAAGANAGAPAQAGAGVAAQGQARGGGARGQGPGGQAPAGGRGGEITINLASLPSAATAQWINTWTGEKSEETLDHPGVYQLRRPMTFGAAPALLVVRAKS